MDISIQNLAILLVTLLGWLSDLQLGDENVTLNHLEWDVFLYMKVGRKLGSDQNLLFELFTATTK